MTSETSQERSAARAERRSIGKANLGTGSDAKRILILTADTGLGHRITAQAIAAALEELAKA